MSPHQTPPPQPPSPNYLPNDLAAVVYSSGKVFEGLETGRVETERFLRSGDTTGITSRHDLDLLRDLKAVALFVTHPVDRERAFSGIRAQYLLSINAKMTRSASIEPGKLRRVEQCIGVNTAYGRHEPPAIGATELDEIIDAALDSTDDHAANAAALFIAVAKSQPFMDGNKRTAIFAANSYLMQRNTGTLMAIPVDDHDPSVAKIFNDLLSRSYVFGENEPVIRMLVDHEFAVQSQT